MNYYKKIIREQIEESINTKKKLLADNIILEKIEEAAKIIIAAYQAKKKVLIAGNGGSAADAQHIAGEFVSRFYFDRPALSALALTTDTSILTAVGNDYGFEDIFSRQIYANGVQGDVFIAISTSGNSKNIIKAISAAKEMSIITIGFIGEKHSLMDGTCDITIKIPSCETPRIQESHITVGHIICCLVEEKIFGKGLL